MANLILKRIFKACLIILTLFVSASPTVAAFTSNDVYCTKQGGTCFYDPSAAACDATSFAASDTTSSLGAVYMIGDSITVRAKNDLEAALQAKATSLYINASVSRSITRPGIDPGYKTSGLQAVQSDRARVEQADTVIIALGTNQDTDFRNAIKNMVSKVKSLNNSARLYWVNTFSKAIDTQGINKDIGGLADGQGYTVIDTSNKNIELSNDNLHETIGKGTQQFAQAISDGLGATPGNSSAASAGAGCKCGAGSTTNLTGSNNEEKIFNYLVGRGLKPYQAAGIMGNMQVESSFNPKALEPNTTGDAPIEGLGYGLVQWTFSDRQAPLIKKAQDSGRKVYDLGLQLEYIFDELEGPYKTVYDELKKSTDYKQATLIIELGYEIHAGGIQPERQANARDILSRYGSNAPGGGGSSDSVTCEASNGSGEMVGQYSLPVPKKWYTQDPGMFTKPHHDYAAADIPVPTGTDVFAAAAGTVSSVSQVDGDGRGVYVEITAGTVVYKYFHGTPGSVKVRQGDSVKAGQLIMISDNSGHSEGPHLHFQIDVNGVKHCPQQLLDAIGKGTEPPKPASLPTSGCSY